MFCFWTLIDMITTYADGMAVSAMSSYLRGLLNSYALWTAPADSTGPETPNKEE